MKESIKRATKENSDIIGEVFNLYRIFYNQESNLDNIFSFYHYFFKPFTISRNVGKEVLIESLS